MILKPFNDIEKADIEALVENRVSEGRTIEYKASLPGSTDKNKKEFLADVSSFANAAGGDLLYGITAVDGIPQDVSGLDSSVDSEILRLENLIRESLDPRILNILIKPIKELGRGCVLLMRIPMSSDAPHAIKSHNQLSFFIRNNAGKHPMSMSELRAVFLDSEASLRGKINDFKSLDDANARNVIASSIRKLADRGVTNFDLRGSRLTGFSFNREDIKSLRKSLFADGLWFDNQRNNFGYMRQIDFSSTDCSCVTFSKGNLSLASYENCIFWEADLQKADFTGATLKWDIESVVADESQWSKVIDETDTGEPIYAQEYLPAFDRADLDHTKFDKCSFEYADFRGAKNIHNASFIGARGLDTCFFDEGVKENLKVR